MQMRICTLSDCNVQYVLISMIAEAVFAYSASRLYARAYSVHAHFQFGMYRTAAYIHHQHAYI
jgi:hypothetical protein